MKKEVIQKVIQLSGQFEKLILNMISIKKVSNARLRQQHARKIYFNCLQIEYTENRDMSNIKEKMKPIINNNCYIETLERHLKDEFSEKNQTKLSKPV